MTELTLRMTEFKSDMDTFRRNKRIEATRMVDKLLVPLEPRAVWHRPYTPGDRPITQEQLAQHTYIEREREREQAIRMFLQKPDPPEIVHIQESAIFTDALLISAIAASLIVGWGWALVVVIRWIGDMLC